MRHEGTGRSRVKLPLPRGVSWDRSHRGKKKYKTRLFFNGRDRFIGRFETIDEASSAYHQAAAYFKQCPADADDPAFLQHVRNLVQHQGSDQRASSDAGAVPSPPQSQTDLEAEGNTKLMDDLTSVQPPLLRQQSLPTSQQSASAAPQHVQQEEDVYGLLGAAGGSAFAPASCPVMPAASSLTASGVDAPYGTRPVGRSSMELESLLDQQLEAVMAQEVMRAMGAMPAPQQQQGTFPPMHASISCNNLPALSSLSGPLESVPRPQSCAPVYPGAVPAAASSLGGCSSLPSVLPSHQQQQEAQCHSDLQQLLHMALQGAGQVEDAAPADLTCDQALSKCCSEFLAATAPPPDAPAVSAPPAALASPQGLAAPQQPCFSTLSAPSARPAQTAAVSEPCGTAPPAPLERQSSLLLQTTSSLDAVLYVAAVVRAVLDLYTAMLAKLFDEDAAADLITWLSVFRQRQQHSGSAAMLAAAGSSAAAAASLEALDGSVVEVMGKMVRMLVTHGAAGKAGSSFLEGAGAGQTAGGPAPLARRSFVMATLERLNGYLVGLHRTLQHQQHMDAQPSALWQQVQQWVQHLQAHAASAEDWMAFQLATLL